MFIKVLINECWLVFLTYFRQLVVWLVFLNFGFREFQIEILGLKNVEILSYSRD